MSRCRMLLIFHHSISLLLLFASNVHTRTTETCKTILTSFSAFVIAVYWIESTKISYESYYILWCCVCVCVDMIVLKHQRSGIQSFHEPWKIWNALNSIDWHKVSWTEIISLFSLIVFHISSSPSSSFNLKQYRASCHPPPSPDHCFVSS